MKKLGIFVNQPIVLNENNKGIILLDLLITVCSLYFLGLHNWCLFQEEGLALEVLSR